MKFASRARARIDRHGNTVAINPFDGSRPGTGANLVTGMHTCLVANKVGGCSPESCGDV